MASVIANKMYAKKKNQNSLLHALPLKEAYFSNKTVFIAVVKLMIFLFKYLINTYYNGYGSIYK